MTRALTATRLDLLCVRPYGRQMLLLLTFAAGLGFLMEDPSIVVSMSAVFTVLVASYPWVVAEANDLETLYAVLPLRRSALVLGRYLFSVTLFLGATVVATGLALAAAGVRGDLPTPSDLALLGAASFAVYALMVGVQYPMYMALGYAKARLVATLPFLVLVAGIVLALPHLDVERLPSPAVAIPLLLAVGTVALTVSWGVSIRIRPRET